MLVLIYRLHISGEFKLKNLTVVSLYEGVLDDIFHLYGQNKNFMTIFSNKN